MNAATRVAGRLARPVAAGCLTAVIAWLLYILGPPGGDAATHAYQLQAVRADGLLLWGNLWYASRYMLVNYSLLYYPLAALLTPAVLVPITLGASSAAFARLALTEWPAIIPWCPVVAALLLGVEVTAGAYPFFLGMAIGIWALVAAQA